MTTDLVAPLQLLAEAEVVTPTALNLPGTVTDDEFRAICKWLGGLRNWTAWAVGDAILWAESVNDNLAAEVVDLSGRAESTCQKWAWLAGKYPHQERVENVSPTHHELVAKLPEHERREWLLDAKANNWNVREFTARVRPEQDGVVCTCRPAQDCPKHGV